MSDSNENRVRAWQAEWQARLVEDLSPFFSTASHISKNNYWSYYETREILWEEGLDERKILDGSLLRVRLSGWSRFVSRPVVPDNLTLVREFYSVLSEVAGGGLVTTLPLRGVSVMFNPKEINRVLGIPSIDPDLHYEVAWNLGDVESRQTHLQSAARALFPSSRRGSPFGVSALDLSRSDRAWKKFLNSRVFILADSDAVSDVEALLLHAIRDPLVDIDCGVLIHREAMMYAMAMDPGRL